MQRSFPATIEGLAACQEFLASVCESPKPQIIMDEIVSNIVRCSGASRFTVDFAPTEDGGMRMEFSDSGRPFDPTATADPDVSASLEDRDVGGLGLFMVRKMSKSVTYERRGECNVLTVVT